jgi:dephospho-CoA kinase
MIKIGLTGSIGMGKSAVSAMFIREGVPVFDADEEVHKLQGPSGALVPRIEARFPGTTGLAGVDRQKLGSLVLGKPTELLALEKIIHPAVYRARQIFLKRHRARALVVLDIPLLFEKGGSKQVDVIVVVSAPLWVQAKRVLSRARMTRLRLAQIRRLQVPDRLKRQRADFVIETGRHKHQTCASVRAVIACLTPKKSG